MTSPKDSALSTCFDIDCRDLEPEPVRRWLLSQEAIEGVTASDLGHFSVLTSDEENAAIQKLESDGMVGVTFRFRMHSAIRVGPNPLTYELRQP